jgi:hypothetical protein
MADKTSQNSKTKMQKLIEILTWYGADAINNSERYPSPYMSDRTKDSSGSNRGL